MEANTAIAERQWHEEMGKQIRELPVLYSHPELEQCVLSSVEPAQGTQCGVYRRNREHNREEPEVDPRNKGQDPTQGSSLGNNPGSPGES